MAKRPFKTAVGRRAADQAQAGRRRSIVAIGGGAVVTAAGVAGTLSGEYFVSPTTAANGLGLIVAGVNERRQANRVQARGRAIEDLVQRARGENLGAKMRKAGPQRRSEVNDAGAKLAAASAAVRAGRQGAAAAPSSDGMTDAHVRRTRSGKVAQVAAFQTPQRRG